MRFIWKIGGEAGFGIMSTGAMFSKLASRSGYYAFGYSEYPSLIRGGHNTFEVVVSLEKLNTLYEPVDMLVCFNRETFVKHKSRLKSDSLVLFDPADFEKEEAELKNFIQIPIPMKQIVKEANVREVMKNTLSLGASCALLGGELGILEQILEQNFADKGDEIVKLNKEFAKKGYEFIMENFAERIRPILKRKDNASKTFVMTGNDAFSLGSVLAECGFYAAYPMTPSSSVLTNLSAWQPESGMIVRHPEDEIAAINNALGSSFAGVRSAVGTSGGGFALMVESVSYAGLAEIPIVILLAQRPGPATGMPTWTEQGDLLFAVHAGHGEFPKIVLAPGDVEEMLEITGEAFNLADIYQLPVIVLSDKFLSETLFTSEDSKLNQIISDYKVDRGKLLERSEGKYLRYKVTDDGISPLLIPGAENNFYQANSYEHLEDSHTTEEAEERIKQVEKRNRKIATYLKNHFQMPKIFGDLNESDLVFVSFGANKGVILQVMKELGKRGIRTGYIHFTHLYPLDEKRISDFFAQIKAPVIAVENNSMAQLSRLLRQEAGVSIKDKILRYDGRPFYFEYLINKLQEKSYV